jgi:hypothetical protein
MMGTTHEDVQAFLRALVTGEKSKTRQVRAQPRGGISHDDVIAHAITWGIPGSDITGAIPSKSA